MLLRYAAITCPLFLLLCGFQGGSAEEIGWRYDGTGHFPADKPPRNWSAKENVVWKTRLSGRSLASPVIVGNRVFVTANPSNLVCLSADDGQIQWTRSHDYRDVFDQAKSQRIEQDHARADEIQRQIGKLHDERREANEARDEAKKEQVQQQINALDQQVRELREYPPAADGEPGNTGSTPVSNGREVFALFGTGIVSSHSLDGELNWMRFVEPGDSKQTASPVVVDGKLIIHLRKLTALNANTGETLWQAESPSRNGSPVLASIDGTPVVITPAGSVVKLADGELLARDQFRLGYSSPLVHGDMLYAMEDGAIKALRLTWEAGDDDRPTLPIVWESKSSRTKRLASPLLHDGLLYGVTEQGILDVLEAETGKQIYRKRLDFDGGRTDPSLCLAGGLIYLSSNRGTTLVLRPGREYDEVARNELVDSSSSLAFAGSRVFVRGKNELWCVGE